MRKLASQNHRRLLLLALGLAVLVGACRTSNKSQTPRIPTQPSVRVYIASTLAGALEPCGCRKDMLGGVDHAAALIAAGSEQAPHSILLGAGPMLFMNPELSAERKSQDTWKAESIASALSHLKLAAWAPGANDFAAGLSRLQALSSSSGAKLLAANLKAAGAPQAFASTLIKKVGQQTVGIAGVTVPKHKGLAPKAITTSAMEPALRKALASLKKQGATLRVALVSAPRGQALRLAERVSGFQVMVVGKPSDSGESNDAPTPPVLVGQTLVVQGPNHLQALGIVDLYVRGDGKVFADATGVAVQEERESLEHRIIDLDSRIGRWRNDSQIKKSDVQAREVELKTLRLKLSQLVSPVIPQQGSFFKYALREVRETVGEHDVVHASMLQYYKRVNAHNKEQFKERKPKPAQKGKAHYSGIKECKECHEEAFAFWKTTGHAQAYATLADDFKEFNLDCVSCHVTGYDKAGGSTVTHVEGLRDVQCESCHGAGSTHAKEEDEELITLTPDVSVCKTCHHAPHVADDWNAADAWSHIVGPGHGEDSKLKK